MILGERGKGKGIDRLAGVYVLESVAGAVSKVIVSAI
jgi:hypothetical protein